MSHTARAVSLGYLACQQTPDTSLRAQLVDEIVAEAQCAESAGFSGVFVSEHHQRSDNFFPSPLILAAVLARHTEKMDVGVTVAVLPLYHPLRLVEDVTCLDIVAHGRFILGLGPGYVPSDLHMYGQTKEEALLRYDEGLKILANSWDGPWSFAGSWYTANVTQITPPPITQPRPTIWIAANTEEGVRRAAAIGDGWVIGARSSLRRAERLAEAYRSACHELGKEPHIAAIRDAWIEDTDDEAFHSIGMPLLTTHKNQVSSGFIRDDLMEKFEPRDVSATTFYAIAADRWFVGDRGRVRDQIRRWVMSVGTSYFVVRFRHSTGPSHEKVLQQIERFSEAILGNKPG